MIELNLSGDYFADMAREILKRGGVFRFKALGSSMNPFIHNGDSLFVKSVPLESLNIGDVLFCTLMTKMVVAHRLVRKQVVNGTATLFFLRGDSAMGSGEIALPRDILGKVVAIKKGNRVKEATKSVNNFRTLTWVHSYPLGPAYLKVVNLTKFHLKWILKTFAASGSVRLLKNRILQKRTRFQILTKTETNVVEAYYKTKIQVNQMDNLEKLLHPPIISKKRNYLVVACLKKKIIGSTRLMSFKDNKNMFPNWWIFGMKVLVPYRGAGIATKLLDLSIKRAREEGARRINLLVEEDNRIAISLYKKGGFSAFSIPELDKKLADEVCRGHKRRIILSRLISTS